MHDLDNLLIVHQIDEIDHYLDNLVLRLPLREVAQDLHGTDSTQDTCASR